MTTNIAYKRCVCDLCGKIKDIDQDLLLPYEWERVEVGYSKYDLCKACLNKIVSFARNMKRLNNTI